MPINISVYSNANSSTRSITFDFMGDKLAASDSTFYSSNAACSDYYLKITTGAYQNNGLSYPNNSYPVKIVRSLSELALNGVKQSQSNTAASYSTVKDLVIDYTFDYIIGHTQNQYLSGCSKQAPMKFN